MLPITHPDVILVTKKKRKENWLKEAAPTNIHLPEGFQGSLKT